MPSFDHLPLFLLAGLLLNLTPGPDVLYIVTQSLRHGTRAGVVAALGICAGCFVHIAAAAVGVGALLAASATAFTVLKWLGAAYLLWMGARMLFSRASLSLGDSEPGQTTSVSMRAVQMQGFWTNVLNPKVALFFLAFLPQFISAAEEHKTLAFLLLGLLFDLNALWVCVGWALLAAWAARRVSLLRRGLHGLERGAGALFIFFGLKLALTDHPGH